MSASLVIRLACAVVLVALIAVAARARAPRRHTPSAELRRLVGGALVLYGAGIIALLAHHATLATFVFAGGVATSALAAWLSRGVGGSGGSDDPPGGPPEEPMGPVGPADRLRPGRAPDPDAIDWQRFDRERSDWARRPPARH